MMARKFEELLIIFPETQHLRKGDKAALEKLPAEIE